ncbi:hypothetical protein [Chryseobacterium indologenes]|uniref:Uncharacterized protein n=1 Tax=Chryseobacterium indologenes TaxID=253 RepID=A0A0N1KS91_CHRID|nr:hypothetical protein [Chryseobacterium indologenes]KPE49900.1 hypothetical protein AOB46_17040 [Chryseobacterium indologenes]
MKTLTMKIYLASFLISLITLIIAVVAVYEAADYINPPITTDGHRYMPTGNVFIALIYSIPAAILSFFISIRIQRPSRER